MVTYLLEKETITGGEMVAIIEGRDPALVDDAYSSTRKAELPGDIEPPARNIHMVSEPVPAPAKEPEAVPAPTEESESAPEAAEAAQEEPAEPETEDKNTPES